MNELKLTLKRNSLPVTILDEESKEQHYEIREMCAADRDQHMDFVKPRLQKNSDGTADIIKFEGIQSDLLGRCLYRVIDGARAKKVPETEIAQWPSSVVQELYQAAQKVNGLVQVEQVVAEAKKD